MEEIRIDMRTQTPQEIEMSVRDAQLCFKLNHTMPYTDEYNAILGELFGDRLGEGSRVMPGLTVVRSKNVTIGKNVVIMNNCLMMSAGGITIDDNALIAANAQLISNNHDLEEHMIITCKPVHLKRNCWIGAGATILPGVTVGENSVVGAGSVVTKDIPDNCIAVGSPAKVVKTINKEKDE
ncbi:MAG: galactoside O-acetyltransferase [Prevotella sp.]|nr:galactoside O-acetyltransferase [Prevotella sp.]MBQ6955876.1 galactoside O-acetyltransferase [Bacteroidales bacterium]